MCTGLSRPVLWETKASSPFLGSVPQQKQAASAERLNTARRRCKHIIFPLLLFHFVARFIELTTNGQEGGVKCENWVISSSKSCLVRSHSTSLKPTWPLCWQRIGRKVLPAVCVLCMEIILRRCLCPPCSQSPVKASAGVSLLFKFVYAGGTFRRLALMASCDIWVSVSSLLFTFTSCHAL